MSKYRIDVLGDRSVRLYESVVGNWFFPTVWEHIKTFNDVYDAELYIRENAKSAEKKSVRYSTYYDKFGNQDYSNLW